MKSKGLKSTRKAQDTSIVQAALSELQSALKQRYGANSPAVLVYGSYARSEASADSDVDVVLLYSREIQPGQEIYQLRDILSTLNLRYQILISVLPVDERQFQHAETVFWKNVRREAVPIDRF